MVRSARRLLQGILVLQAVFALLVAGAALALGAPAWAALLAGLGGVVLVRLAINLNNFLLSSRAASPTPEPYRLDWRARLRLFLEEFRCSMLVTSWHVPRGRAALRVHADSTHPPVLLIHGYGCNSGYWAWLVPLLDAARISHAGVDLEPVGGDIDDFAQLVEQRVRALCAATGAPQVAIVAHSMGGLVARAWMRRYGTARVARVVTLGSPHHGTALARFGPGTNALQMRMDSPWLRALAAAETAQTRALVTSIYTHQDNIVSPQTTSELPGARNIGFGGVGHVALGRNPRVLAAVMQELEALEALA
ncbi:alpha/beta fold hydrolase [uncultured Massilia sp.]|uniref:lipase family alpha/beta hydrolase n=1 Tax=uncultured Massilia sp. TaxID=169973 RepID=UPI0025EA762C|nr:alpha/beta fold hydrolase [uncultured Massilia sp.]